MSRLEVSAIGNEVMDDPAADPLLIDRMLRDITVSNRLFGGGSSVIEGLAELTEPNDCGRSLSMVDFGTGAGDLPRTAVEWGRRQGISIVPIGLELHPAAARLAWSNGIATAVACGSRPPLRAASVDLVLISQLVHHLSDKAAEQLLRAAHRVAIRGVIVADLRPSPSAKVAFRCAGAVLRFNPLTVTDGLTSLDRGRNPLELSSLIERAVGKCPVVQKLRFARVVATWRTDN